MQESRFPWLLLLELRRPAEAHRYCGPIILPLNHVLRAALIEAEDFIGQVQAIHDKREAMAQLITSLSVHLQMRVKVGIAERPIEAACRCRTGVGVDIGLVIGKPYANRDPPAVIC